MLEPESTGPKTPSPIPRGTGTVGLCQLFSLTLALFLLAGCTTMSKPSALVLTPVTETPTGIHYPGKFVWNDLLTSDVAAARDFYGQLFGWTFEESGRYTVISSDGTGIGGMVQLREKSAKPGASRWLCSLSVDDVDQAADLVAKQGGKVHEGPLELVNRGRGALVSDPQGAQLLILHTAGGDPEDEEPAVGSWLWHELWSNQPQASLAFYQELAGYDVTGDPEDYLILTRDDHWRAGIRFVDNSDLEMRWVPVVRVDDTEAIAEWARQLGGKVPVGPRPTDDGGSVALLADPTGALVIVQRWTAPNAGQEK